MSAGLSLHDGFFKKFLGDLAVARDFLDIHLLESLRQQCDLVRYMVSGSFIEDDLCSQCSDMLYSLKSTLGDAYIYCLIEHQSCPEPMMAFRLLRYAVTAMHRHLEQENKQLPVVIPILFYHGSTSPYPYTTHWLDCFADRKLAESVYEKAFPLVDVTAMEDEEILRHRRMALMEVVQKHIRTRDMLELAGELANLLEQWKFSKEQCKTLVYYLVLAGNTTDGEGFLRTLAQPAPSYREDMMTIAEQLEAKGMQKGIQLGEKKGIERGLQEGIQLGKKQATLKIARQFLVNGVERDIVKMSTGLTDRDINDVLN